MEIEALLARAQALLEENQRLRDEVHALRLMIDEQHAEIQRLTVENAKLNSRIRRPASDGRNED